MKRFFAIIFILSGIAGVIAGYYYAGRCVPHFDIALLNVPELINDYLSSIIRGLLIFLSGTSVAAIYVVAFVKFEGISFPDLVKGFFEYCIDGFKECYNHNDPFLGEEEKDKDPFLSL